MPHGLERQRAEAEVPRLDQIGHAGFVGGVKERLKAHLRADGLADLVHGFGFRLGIVKAGLAEESVLSATIRLVKRLGLTHQSFLPRDGG